MPAGPIGAACTMLNSASIGIEIVNPGHEFGYRPFPEQQMEALLPLLAGIVRRYNIAPANVVGHSDIAPTRKQDPGELFDWALLARHHLAIPRPTEGLVDPHWTDGGFLLALERWGYDVHDPLAATIAFQRRFRPELLDGTIDGECRAILLQLLLGPRARTDYIGPARGLGGRGSRGGARKVRAPWNDGAG